jgi:hypothetical protein
MTEIERQAKLIDGLHRKRIDLDNKLNKARQRKATFDADQQALLARLADGDDSARKALTKLATELQEIDQDLSAYTAAVATNATQLQAAEQAFKRAQDAEAIAALEAEIATFGVLDGELNASLQNVSHKTAVLFQAIHRVGDILIAKNEKKYGRFSSHLVSEITRSLFFRFQAMGDPNAKPRASFAETVAPDLRRIVAELRFEAAGRTMTPGRDQKLYTVLFNSGNLASAVAKVGQPDVEWCPGDRVALQPDDPLTSKMLRDGTITEIEQQEAAAAEAA